MNTKGLEILLFIIIITGILIIGITDNHYHDDTKININTDISLLNQPEIKEFDVEQTIYALGCITLECAIEKSMRK